MVESAKNKIPCTSYRLQNMLCEDLDTDDIQKQCIDCMANQNDQTIFLIETLFDEIEDDILKEDIDVVREKLIVCQRLVKSDIHCSNKKDLQGEYRKRIEELCNIAQISLNQDAKLRYLIDEKNMKYKDAIHYLTKKIENLQPKYDSGDIRECIWQLLIISKGIRELPDNADTKVLKQQLEYWDNMVASFGKEDDV